MNMLPTPSRHRLEIVRPDPFGLTPLADLAGLESVGYIHGGEAYASASLRAEIESVRKLGGLTRGAVYHGTNSAALAGIALHKNILSSGQLLQLGYTVQTGEISQPQGEIHKNQGGLDDIYACYDAAYTQYAFNFNTNDAYPVIFGIHNVAVRDSYSDGLKLGPRVPLDKVVSLTVPHEQLSTVQEWAQANCNNDPVVLSQQAAFVLSASRA